MLAALEAVIPGKVTKVDWTFRFASRLKMVKVKGVDTPTDVVVTAAGKVIAKTAAGRTNLDDPKLDQHLTDMFSSFGRSKDAKKPGCLMTVKGEKGLYIGAYLMGSESWIDALPALDKIQVHARARSPTLSLTSLHDPSYSTIQSCVQ